MKKSPLDRTLVLLDESKIVKWWASTEANDSPTASDKAVVCKELLGGFVATQKQYPSGLEYLEVTHGKTVLGTCCIQPSGGFIVLGKRKPVPTVRAAVLQMVGDHLNECRKEETKWRKKLAHFTSTNPPNADISHGANL